MTTRLQVQKGPQIGDLVTCKEKTEAYGYHREPFNYTDFEPGDIGIVAAIDVPSVTREHVSFMCVDFFKIGSKGEPHGYNWLGEESPWRCALLYDNYIKLEGK